jgi:hypothetical protein
LAGSPITRVATGVGRGSYFAIGEPGANFFEVLRPLGFVWRHGDRALHLRFGFAEFCAGFLGPAEADKRCADVVFRDGKLALPPGIGGVLGRDTQEDLDGFAIGGERVRVASLPQESVADRVQSSPEREASRLMDVHGGLAAGGKGLDDVEGAKPGEPGGAFLVALDSRLPVCS